MVRSLNFLAFYLAWFACVWGGATERPWLGPAVVAAWLLAHLARCEAPRSELLLAAGITAAGTAIDSALSDLGWYQFAGVGDRRNWICPVWMMALWTAFATTLHSSMDWLQGRLRWAALLGAISGPASYLAGQRMGAIHLGSPIFGTLLLLSGVWAVVVPISLLAAARTKPRAAETRE